MMPAAASIPEAVPKGERAQTSGTSQALVAVGFGLMMLIGAGAAALVFHDRVTEIVTQWQSASR